MSATVKISMEKLNELMFKLCKKLKNYSPDVIVGILRGGVVPALWISHYLKNKNMYSIKINFYEGTEKGKEPELEQGLPIEIKGKKILLVDDVSDSGGTLSYALGYLKTKKPAEIKVATLHIKEGTELVPDFWVEKVSKETWLSYPWESDVGGVTSFEIFENSKRD